MLNRQRFNSSKNGLASQEPSFCGYAELLKLIDNSAVVSFDFFDTLFVRTLASPEDAFDIIGSRCGIGDFRERRRLAQTAAFQRMHGNGRNEITLQDIYSCFPEGPVPSHELMALEYELELSLIEPNPEIFKLFQDLLASGKTVVITSDMYFSERFFRDALEPCGFSHVPLFISSDCNATKRDSGMLFEIVAQRLGFEPAEILHIGDNFLADVQRPREKGMVAFHYQACLEERANKKCSLATSIGVGLFRTRGQHITPGSFAELGFVYGGPTTVGFLEWIRAQAHHDKIDHVLFLSRDGYALDRVARTSLAGELPKFSYFLGSRTAFTLASVTAENFRQFIPFFLSGGIGLTSSELLERIGVSAPSPAVMSDLGLGADVTVTPSLHDKLSNFFFAYRWEILKVCQKNRRMLFKYLHQQGIERGSRVALVDVGWSGTTQEAFEMAVKPLMNLDVFGYYFCLAQTPDRRRRQFTQRMTAMLDAENTSSELLDEIYKNRVIVECFFSAPHHSVIGFQSTGEVVEGVLDAGRGEVAALSAMADEIVSGIECFSEHYFSWSKRLGFHLTPHQSTLSMVELVTGKSGKYGEVLRGVSNFDAWGSSRNHQLKLSNYH